MNKVNEALIKNIKEINHSIETNLIQRTDLRKELESSKADLLRKIDLVKQECNELSSKVNSKDKYGETNYIERLVRIEVSNDAIKDDTK